MFSVTFYLVVILGLQRFIPSCGIQSDYCQAWYKDCLEYRPIVNKPHKETKYGQKSTMFNVGIRNNNREVRIGRKLSAMEAVVQL